MVKTLAIVSLSSGVIGESFVSHEKEIGVERLKSFGLEVRFMPNALKGIDYLKAHPEKRAEDLIEAFRDPEIGMILCAIGGDDTYRLLPYLLENDRLKKVLRKKIFLGFSDTTINHFMLHKLGLNTFYGQSFLADICELSSDMLPYTKKYFTSLVKTGTVHEITPSEVWYENRTSFKADQIGVPPVSHTDKGFELLQGSPRFRGSILGGCIDSMYDMFDGGRYEDMPSVCEKYGIFPSAEDWRGRILLIESSEEKMPPDAYRKALGFLKKKGVFDSVSGVLAGKPMDLAFEEEYKKILVEVIDDPELPVVFNLNVGHALPRCIIPFGVPAEVDAEKQIIRFLGN